MTSIQTEQQFLSKDREHILHPFSVLTKVEGPVFTEGHGIMLKDVNGKEYMDLLGGVVSKIGHGRKEVVECAMAQMSKLEFSSIFRGQTHTAVVNLAEKLAEITPLTLKRFHFTSGGSEANDQAIKIARLYWGNKGKTEKNKVISLSNSYHGCSLAMTSCSGSEQYHTGFRPLSGDYIHIPPPWCYHCSFNEAYPNCDLECAQALSRTIEMAGEDSIAAFISQPVGTGSSGGVVPPPEYWPRVRKICTDHNVLLIADEVVTAPGLTGKMWGVQNWNLIPDLLTTAKGLGGGYFPIGAVVFTDEIYQGLLDKPFVSGYTFSGHPTGCAVAGKVIDIILKEKLVENAAKVGKHLQSRLAEFKDMSHVGEAVSFGLIGGIHLVKDKATKTPFPPGKRPSDEIVERAREEGFLLRSIPEVDRISIVPPLTITNEEIDKAIDNLKPKIASLRVD